MSTPADAAPQPEVLMPAEIVARIIIHLEDKPLTLFELSLEKWDWFLPIPRKLLLYAAGSFMGVQGKLYDDMGCTSIAITDGDEGKMPKDLYFRSNDHTAKCQGLPGALHKAKSPSSASGSSKAPSTGSADKVKERDSRRCVVTGRGATLQGAHIVPRTLAPRIMKSLSKRRASAESAVTDVHSPRNLLSLNSSIHGDFDACILALLSVPNWAMPNIRTDLVDFKLLPYATQKEREYYDTCKADRSRPVVLLQVFATFSDQKALDLFPATPFSLCYVDLLDPTQAPEWLLGVHYGRAAFVQLCPTANKAQIAHLWQGAPTNSSNSSRKSSSAHSSHAGSSVKSDRNARETTKKQRDSHESPAQNRGSTFNKTSHQAHADSARDTLDPSFKAMLALQDVISRGADDSGFIEPSLEAEQDESDTESSDGKVEKWLQKLDVIQPGAVEQEGW